MRKLMPLLLVNKQVDINNTVGVKMGAQNFPKITQTMKMPEQNRKKSQLERRKGYNSNNQDRT